MLRFRLEVAGDSALGAIARFIEGLIDYRPVWPAIESAFYALERDQFRTEGAETGQKWQALNVKYAGWKEVHFPGRPVLERTGELRRSLTDPYDANAVVIEQPATLTLGTGVPYAVYHQGGAAKMPARPVIPTSEDFRLGLMHHIRSYLVELAQKEFGGNG